MKVCIARAIALSVLLHGAAAAAVAMNSNRAVAFGPQNCVSLTRSDAGSCVLATDCGAADLSKTEFAFDCVGRDGIVRHSFGNGGFDSNEEFDTEVKCDRCDKISAEDVMATNVEKPAAEAAPVPPKPVQRATLKVEVPQAMPASVVFKAKSRQTVKTEAKAEKKAKVWPFSDKEWKQITGGSEKKDEAARYGPDGCVSTWKSPENHCIMQTKCKDVDISKYEFGLVCVDKVGSPVRHLFGKDSFDEEETFESTDAGSSETYPMEAGQIRKGGFIMIKDKPCKVIEVTSSKTGKHGHAKCHFVALDIFTGKKVEDLVPASHTTRVPFVKKLTFQCMDVDSEGFVSCMDEDGNVREDLKLPNVMAQKPPNGDEVSARIMELLEAGKDFYIIVQQACGTEMIMDTKVMTGD